MSASPGCEAGRSCRCARKQGASPVSTAAAAGCSQTAPIITTAAQRGFERRDRMALLQRGCALAGNRAEIRSGGGGGAVADLVFPVLAVNGRKSVVWGKSVAVSVDHGWQGVNQKKKNKKT